MAQREVRKWRKDLDRSLTFTIIGENSYMKKTPGRPESPANREICFSCFVTEYWSVGRGERKD